jgi:hypothetical protein
MFFVARFISLAIQYMSQSCSSGGIGRIGSEVHMNKQDSNDYMVLFGGARISRHQAKRVGFGLIFGFVGVLISVGIFGPDNRLAALVIALLFAFIGYFGLGKRPSSE